MQRKEIIQWIVAHPEPIVGSDLGASRRIGPKAELAHAKRWLMQIVILSSRTCILSHSFSLEKLKQKALDVIGNEV